MLILSRRKKSVWDDPEYVSALLLSSHDPLGCSLGNLSLVPQPSLPGVVEALMAALCCTEQSRRCGITSLPLALEMRLGGAHGGHPQREWEAWSHMSCSGLCPGAACSPSSCPASPPHPAQLTTVRSLWCSCLTCCPANPSVVTVAVGPLASAEAGVSSKW